MPVKKLNLTQSTAASTQESKSQNTKKKGEVVGPPQKSQEVKVKPKKPQNAFLCFTSKHVKTLVEKQGINHQDGFKKCAEMWNKMDEEAKKEWVDASQQDHIRYECEVKQMQETGYFTNKDGVCSSSLKVKVKKAKGAVGGEKEVKPKKACVPFMFLVKERAKEVMAEHKCSSAAGAIKILGEVWKNMPEEEK